jgi:hypothetical protein
MISSQDCKAIRLRAHCAALEISTRSNLAGHRNIVGGVSTVGIADIVVRKVEKTDSAAVAQTLPSAFCNYPVFSFFLPNDSTRLKKLETAMRVLFKFGAVPQACTLHSGGSWSKSSS